MNSTANILFLNHEQVCHAHDTFLNGCLSVFGQEHVFEFPCIAKNHSDYKSHGHSYAWWCFNQLNHITSLDLFTWANEINRGNITYIVGNNRSIDTFITLLSMIDDAILSKMCIIFLEEEEDPGFEHHRWCLEKLKDLYYKIDIHYKVDYIPGRVGSYSKIKPFYISAPEQKILTEISNVKSFKQREIDVCYIVGASHPNRKKYFDILKDIPGNNIIEYGTHHYNLTEYFNVINNSKIFVSVRGNGWSNTRNVEGPICGAALFTEELAITIPYDYEHSKNAIFFNESNLKEQIIFYLQNPKLLSKLAKASNQHCLKFHTSEARAKQMLKDAAIIKGW